MTIEEYYPIIDQVLTLILANIEKIVVYSQAMMILCCGIIIYHLFWGSRR